MASFTDNLASVNSSRRIIDPQNNKGPTFLEGLANLATNVVSGGSQVYRQNQQANQQRATAAAKAAEATAENAAAGWAMDLQTGSGQFAPVAQPTQPTPNVPVASQRGDGQPVPIDSSLEGAPPPPGMDRVIQEVNRAQAAEDQGRAPTGTAQITLEAKLADLRARFPDQQAVIAKTFREAGIDHFLFRSFETEQKVFETRRDAELNSFNTAVEAATKAGLALPGLAPEQIAATGREILKNEYQLNLLKEQRTLEAAAAAEGRAQVGFDQTQFDRNATGTYLNMFNSTTTPLYNYVSSRITEAGMTDDQGNVRSLEQVLPEAIQGIDQITNNLISRATADQAGPEVLAAIRQRGADLKASITTLYSGDGSQFQIRKQSLESIQTNLGLNAAEAMPIYSGLVELMGQGAVNQIFQNNPAAMLPPGTIERLKKELSGIQGVVDTSGERASMATVAGVLRGELNIDQLNERQARDVIPTMAATHEGNANDFIRGGGNPRAYVNSGFALVNAAVELQPGQDQSRYREVTIAQNYLFQPNQLQADLKLAQDNPAQGDLLIAGKRAAATHTLQLGQRMQLPEAQRAMGWRVEYVNGVYRSRLDRAAYERYRASTPNRSTVSTPYGSAMSIGNTRSALPEYDQAITRLPQAIKDQVWGMNLSLTYLAETSQKDEQFKGVSKNEVRRFFGTGEVPAAMRQRAQAGNEGSSYQVRDAQFRQTIGNAVNESITGAAESMAAAPARAGAERVMNYEARAAGFNSLPASVQTLGDFSEFAKQVNRAGADSSAAGIYQITGQTLRGKNEQNGYAEKVFGPNWRSVPWTAEAQDKIAEAIFNDHKGSAQALRGQWVSLSLAEAERIRTLPWSQARRVIAAGESG